MSDQFNINAHENCSIALVGKEMRPKITTKFGIADAYKADFVNLSTGERYEDVLLFQKALISQLKEAKDSVIGKLVRRPVKGDPERTYFVVEDPTTADLRLAAVAGV
jgi:hypothetical protein